MTSVTEGLIRYSDITPKYGLSSVLEWAFCLRVAEAKRAVLV